MRIRMQQCLWLMSVLALPAWVRAYPADSLLLVRRTMLSASGDTLSWAKYEYARDSRDDWYTKQYEYSHDTLKFASIMVLDGAARLVLDSLFSFDRATGGTWSTVRSEYDATGKAIRSTVVTGDSTLYAMDYKYDSAGNLLMTTILPNTKGTSSAFRYEYDAQGRKTASYYLLDDTVITSHHYVYDGNGREISDVLFNRKGDTASITSIGYDNAGRRIREVDSVLGDTSGILGGETRNEYDAVGHLITVKEYAGKGVLQSTEKYEYQQIAVPLALAGRLRRDAATPASALRGFVWDPLGRRVPFPGAVKWATAGFTKVFP